VDEFGGDEAIGAVSGLVLPAELLTESQAMFEQFGGHSKGRGFTRAVFDRGYQRHRQSPLYPLPPFGVGANMAFRAEAIRQAGSFDRALGAGTPTSGAEDTAAFTEVMLAGWTMVYTPNALTWHYHRDDPAELHRQLTGYGVGLGAFYSAILLRHPWRIFTLLRLLPTAYRDFARTDSLRNASLATLPPEVGRDNLRGILRGPVVYLRERLRGSRWA
jgi:cellulose synthase/poly-beta-1,6-N-acetylglucosamine synthase-like glycosyltransferase